MLPLETYYRKLAKGKARMEEAGLTETITGPVMMYVLKHIEHDKETGDPLPEVEFARFTLADVIREKRALKDRVDALQQMQAELEALIPE